MERHSFAMEIKKGKKNEYRQILGEIWPDLTAFLDQEKVHNFSIWNCDSLIFGYYETDENNEFSEEKKASIQALTSRIDHMVIGIVKRDYDDSDIYITPTMKEIEELMEVKPEIIAMDATISKRPGGKTLDEFFKEVKAKYPDQLFMADCSTVEEALHADELGFDFIGTTMVGYTEQSKGDKIEANDFEILRKIVAKAKHRVIAEGNINTPEKARHVIELGAYSVVVGSIITRPQLITKSFVEEMER